MKAASVATRNILAGGQALRADLYQITLLNGTVYRFTTHQTQLTVSGLVYGTGILFERGPVTQLAGLEVQRFDLTMTPQPDSPLAPILFGGLPLQQACRLGVFDGAGLLFSKLFLLSYDDTSPGAVPWVQGKMNTISWGRAQAHFTVNDLIQGLNVAMPRNVIQPTCLHMVYDTGCTLSRATFTQTGAFTGTPTQTSGATNLTRADDYFELGTLKFTSGVMNGLSYVLRTYKNSGGTVAPIRPFLVAPPAGTTFTITPTCKKTQAACSNTNVANGPALNNLAHFRGAPYVPVPETLYAGSTAAATVPTPGSQGGAGSGSSVSSVSGRAGSYTP
jgi:uncharacterized phage protein (TIGR02218 family)